MGHSAKETMQQKERAGSGQILKKRGVSNFGQVFIKKGVRKLLPTMHLPDVSRRELVTIVV